MGTASFPTVVFLTLLSYYRDFPYKLAASRLGCASPGDMTYAGAGWAEACMVKWLVGQLLKKGLMLLLSC